ncbi:hypothetical protein M885DRAFT_626136 [Pelagophyceae sp. CCMP2097]|nr:hypothetical protein M885DRAFT_626136 [Pelagophyceae sp. CCMP2097]
MLSLLSAFKGRPAAAAGEYASGGETPAYEWRLAGAREGLRRAAESCAEPPATPPAAAAVARAARGAEAAAALLVRLESFCGHRAEGLARRGADEAAAAALLFGGGAAPQRLARSVGALRSLAAAQAAGCRAAAAEWEAAHRRLRDDAAEAQDALREVQEALCRARAAADASASAVGACRSVIRRAEGRLGAARRAHDADRGDRRHLDRVADCELKVAHGRRELAAAADAAISDLAEREACDHAAFLSLRALARDFCAPRCRRTLRALAGADRRGAGVDARALAAFDAALLLDDEEDTAPRESDDETQDSEVEQPASDDGDAAAADWVAVSPSPASPTAAPPPSAPPAAQHQCASRALELLREAGAWTGAGPFGQPKQCAVDVDGLVCALFAVDGAAAAESARELSAHYASSAADVLADVASSAGFDAARARRLVSGMFFDSEDTSAVGAPEAAALPPAAEGAGADAPPAEHARLLVAFIDTEPGQARGAHARNARAGLVARALNRQRSRRTQLDSPRHLHALGTIANKILDACDANGDVKTPILVAMLAQTFYINVDDAWTRVDGLRDGRRDDDETRRRRDEQRLYLKEEVRAHETWLRRAFWDAAMHGAARDAVRAAAFPPYTAVVSSPEGDETTRRVSQIVAAQLAALCLAQRELGAPREGVRNFACAACHRYGLCLESAAGAATLDDFLIAC